MRNALLYSLKKRHWPSSKFLILFTAFGYQMKHIFSCLMYFSRYLDIKYSVLVMHLFGGQPRCLFLSTLAF